MFDEKAQMHTLEGVAAATIMLLVIVYAIEATSLTPLTSSTANVHVESELEAMGQDILGSLDYAEPGYNSPLKWDVINWTGNRYIWSGTAYASGNLILNNNLTSVLKSTLVKRGIAHNVDLVYLSNNGTSISTASMIYNGNPSNNAVIVSRKLVLQNVQGGVDVVDVTMFPFNTTIRDIDLSSNFYNIVDVRLVLWRM